MKGPLDRVADILGHPVHFGGIDEALRPKPTTPGDWLLSLREIRIEIGHHTGLEVHAGRLFNHAGLVCNGSSHLMRDAILELVDRGVLTPTRYGPWMPAPTLMGSGVAPMDHVTHDTWEGRRTHPLHWFYRLPKRDDLEAMGIDLNTKKVLKG